MADLTVTQLLHSIRGGDLEAREQLASRLFDELHKLASARLRSERYGHTLQPTELVNEAYLRLDAGQLEFDNRGHFFASAATAMRRVLVEHARRRASAKRGGGVSPVTFEDMGVAGNDQHLDLLALDDALSALEAHDARLAKVVELRYFVGLSIPETAEAMGSSPATVKRDWVYARAWLYERMME
ncbi:MAG: ECF-type sigma factor [Acidobacteriota bacterium]